MSKERVSNMKEMLQLFRNKIYARFFLANILERLGSMIAGISLMFYLLDQYGKQPIYATTTQIMMALPSLVFFLMVGTVVDRFDRQRICTISNICCSLCNIGILISLYYGMIILVFIFLFLENACIQFFSPSEQAMIQGVVHSDQYGAAAGINQMVNSLYALFGVGIATMVYWTFGIYGSILVNTLTFMASGILIQTISIQESVRLPNGRTEWKQVNVKMLLTEFKEGLRYIYQNDTLKKLLLGFIVFGLLNGVLSVSSTYILKYKLAPETYEGLAMVGGVVGGIAMLLGSIVATSIGKKYTPKAIIVFGMLGSAVFFGMCYFVNQVWSFYVCIGLATFFLPFINIAVSGWMYEIVDESFMGRVQSLLSPLTTGFQLLSLGAIAMLFPRWLHADTLYLILFGLLICVTCLYQVILPSGQKQVKGVVEEM
ncbi:MFS transporter [Bacillus pseudomycoides]|uniref:MFS transporter n=2 Tax=Bacillus TaxID=1386 RepID=A0AA91V9H7_9BACI|nr:MFS transporter [Bacillus sp. AFS098217]PED81045.1 MFS transporter [Bacillus pseudomycoides]PEU05467.1 MFS transporter [Bacillus sp. AFS019443]PEU18066.1 MFS transporter [Bacillus sp. AFS014408]PFW62211.1 MFS transporter [Bacillus sp. AFS075034]